MDNDRTAIQMNDTPDITTTSVEATNPHSTVAGVENNGVDPLATIAVVGAVALAGSLRFISGLTNTSHRSHRPSADADYGILRRGLVKLRNFISPHGDQY